MVDQYYFQRLRLYRISYRILLGHQAALGLLSKQNVSYTVFPFIIIIRNNIHILNLSTTIIQIRKALNTLFLRIYSRGTFLLHAPSLRFFKFSVKPHLLALRWVGGLLTNPRLRKRLAITTFHKEYFDFASERSKVVLRQKAKFTPNPLPSRISKQRACQICATPSYCFSAKYDPIVMDEIHGLRIEGSCLTANGNYQAYPLLLMNDFNYVLLRLIIDLFCETMLQSLLSQIIFFKKVNRITPWFNTKLLKKKFSVKLKKRIKKTHLKKLVKCAKQKAKQKKRKTRITTRKFRIKQRRKQRSFLLRQVIEKLICRPFVESSVVYSKLKHLDLYMKRHLVKIYMAMSVKSYRKWANIPLKVLRRQAHRVHTFYQAFKLKISRKKRLSQLIRLFKPKSRTPRLPKLERQLKYSEKTWVLLCKDKMKYERKKPHRYAKFGYFTPIVHFLLNTRAVNRHCDHLAMEFRDRKKVTPYVFPYHKLNPYPTNILVSPLPKEDRYRYLKMPTRIEHPDDLYRPFYKRDNTPNYRPNEYLYRKLQLKFRYVTKYKKIVHNIFANVKKAYRKLKTLGMLKSQLKDLPHPRYERHVWRLQLNAVTNILTCMIRELLPWNQIHRRRKVYSAKLKRRKRLRFFSDIRIQYPDIVQHLQLKSLIDFGRYRKDRSPKQKHTSLLLPQVVRFSFWGSFRDYIAKRTRPYRLRQYRRYWGPYATQKGLLWKGKRRNNKTRIRSPKITRIRSPRIPQVTKPKSAHLSINIWDRVHRTYRTLTRLGIKQASTSKRSLHLGTFFQPLNKMGVADTTIKKKHSFMYILRYYTKVSFKDLTFKERVQLVLYAYSTFLYGCFLAIFNICMKSTILRYLYENNFVHLSCAIPYGLNIYWAFIGLAFWGHAYRIELMSKVLMEDPILNKRLFKLSKLMRRSPFPTLSFIGRTGGVGGAAMSSGGGPQGSGWGLALAAFSIGVTTFGVQYRKYKSNQTTQAEMTKQRTYAQQEETKRHAHAQKTKKYKANAREQTRMRSDLYQARTRQYEAEVKAYNARPWHSKGKPPIPPTF